MKFDFISLCPRVAGCVVTCSKNIKTVGEMGDDKDIPKVEKRIQISNYLRGCRRIDKGTRLKSIQFRHPAGRNTMVESNKWKKWKMLKRKQSTSFWHLQNVHRSFSIRYHC